MPDNGAVIPIEGDARGVSSLVREMVQQYREFTQTYQARTGMSAAEAHEKAVEPANDYVRDRTLTVEPDQVSWHDLSSLGERDPALVQQVWGRLVNQARDELASGHRAARVIEGYEHSPWGRARFLVLRESLVGQWQPANGVEWLLVDMLVQAFTAYEEAMKLFMLYTTMEASVQDTNIQRTNKWELPRQSRDDARTQAEQTVDRCQRAILRVQRALRDQRRYGPVIVQHAGQVNVGQQQVNVASNDSQRPSVVPS